MGFIYIVSSAKSAKHKIGFSSDPCARIAIISKETVLSSPVAVYYGTIQDEKALHEMFSSKRISGEWFALCSKDLSAIEEYFSDHRMQARKLSELSAALISISIETKSGAATRKYTDPPGFVVLSNVESAACAAYKLSEKTVRIVKFEMSKNQDISARDLSLMLGYSCSTIQKAQACIRPTT